MHVGPASHGRTGNSVEFSVDYCAPPNPNPTHLGCYRSELALQRDVQDTLINWKFGVGSSERWFGFSNRLVNFTYDGAGTPLNGPSFQLHGGGGLKSLAAGHPNLNLQVDSTGCSQANRSCPVWTLGISNTFGPGSPQCSEAYPVCFVLGRAADDRGNFEGWNDWVLQWKGSPVATEGHVAVWRNGKEVLPMQKLATTYNDTVAPYVKFGVYRGQWKGAGRPAHSNSSTIAYGGLKVGDEHSSYDEVSTAQAKVVAVV